MAKLGFGCLFPYENGRSGPVMYWLVFTSGTATKNPGNTLSSGEDRTDSMYGVFPGAGRNDGDWNAMPIVYRPAICLQVMAEYLVGGVITMKNPRSMAAVCGVLSSLVTMSSQAAFVPVGLNPGDTYQLVFVTRDTRDGASDAVNVYNDFVNNQAALNATFTGTDSGVTYSAIVSTGSGGSINTEAINNISVSGPVYNLAGELVANGSTDLWDGSINAAVRYDQFGQSTSQSVWTGTYADGTAYGLFGYRYLGGQDPWVGRSDLGGAAAGVNWISAGFVPTTYEYSLYAISTVLTAPNPVPLPAAAWLFGSALLGVAAVKRKRV